MKLWLFRDVSGHMNSIELLVKTKVRCTTVGKHSQHAILFRLRNKMLAGYVTCNDKKMSQKVHRGRSATGFQ